MEEVQQEYGITVNLNTRSRHVRDIVNLCREEISDKERIFDPQRSKYVCCEEFRLNSTSFMQIAHAASALCGEAVRAHAETDMSPHTQQQPDDDLDTLTSIVNYTRRHEALMAYYYMEDGQMKVTEIFGVPESNDDAPLPLLPAHHVSDVCACDLMLTVAIECGRRVDAAHAQSTCIGGTST